MQEDEHQQDRTHQYSHALMFHRVYHNHHRTLLLALVFHLLHRVHMARDCSEYHLELLQYIMTSVSR